MFDGTENMIYSHHQILHSVLKLGDLSSSSVLVLEEVSVLSDLLQLSVLLVLFPTWSIHRTGHRFLNLSSFPWRMIFVGCLPANVLCIKISEFGDGGR